VRGNGLAALANKHRGGELDTKSFLEKQNEQQRMVSGFDYPEVINFQL